MANGSIYGVLVELDYTRFGFGFIFNLACSINGSLYCNTLHHFHCIRNWRMAKKKYKKTKQTAAPVTPRKHLFLGMGLVSMLCLLVFGRNITFDVFSIDIPKMIFNNPHIMTGFSRENIWWAFTEPNLALYQPFPNLLYMAESYLFGNWPGGFHVMTLLWHIACMCLFLWVMARLLNNFAVALAATLLMAVHPVQILVVSQIATRGEIMQGFFMLLSIDAYRRYVQQGSRRAYMLSVFFMFLGLFNKQTIMMLPVVLLLLDYWPLNRIEISFRNYRNTLQTGIRLILEKAPWFALSILGGCFAIYGKMQYDQIRYHLSKLTPFDAVYFVITGYARYVGHLLYPLRPSYFEVYSEDQTLGFFLVCTAALVFIFAVTFYYIKKRPYLIVGWFWFIAFMLPVSGVLRYMMESIALRYMYMPAMGLYIAVLMGLHEFATRKAVEVNTESGESVPDSRATPLWYWASVGTVTVILAALTFWQNGFFANTETTALQLERITGDRSALGNNALATLRMQQGRYEEAEKHFRRCVEIQPKSYVFRYYYGGALFQYGRYKEVVDVMAPAVIAVPDASEYLELYGLGLMATGRLKEAEAQFRKCFELEPDVVSVLQNLAYCLILQQKNEEALEHITHLLRLDPNNESAKQLKQMAENTGKVMEIPERQPISKPAP